MGLIMRGQRQSSPEPAPKNMTPMVNCCLPGKTLAAFESDNPSQRLTELRERRAALERDLAELIPQ